MTDRSKAQLTEQRAPAETENGLVDGAIPRVKHVPQPHPAWRPGEKQPHPFPSDKRLQMDPEELGAMIYPFIISSIAPRPIAFISSLSKEGKGNLSPYSYFNVMSHNPPFVTIGCCASRDRDNFMKDSQQNILETGEFTLNMMSEWFVEAANHTCGNYDRGVNELELAGFTPLPSVKVKPPRIAESAMHMECKLAHTYECKNSKGHVTSTIIIGRVVMIHVLEAVTVAQTDPSKPPTVSIDKYAPVCRLGGDSYGRLTEVYDIPRPDKHWQERGGAAVDTSGAEPIAGG